MTLARRLSVLALCALIGTYAVASDDAKDTAKTPHAAKTKKAEAKKPADKKAEATKAEEKKGDDKKSDDSLSVTRHSITLDGQRLDYTATAGTLAMKKETGELRANVFFIAYTKDGADKTKRPVTFTFNGGPGSSSVWLHLGAFGPKRVQLGPDGEAVPPPYRLVPNESSILDLTDLVFIDPVSTGFSRPAKDVPPKEFHGVNEDVQSVGDFIQLYLSRFDRWGSPKFLAGESYGTTRAGALAEHLADRHGIYLNGILLISPVLDFQTISFGQGNDLPYVLFLPSFSATAWYHKKAGQEPKRELADFLKEAEAFAAGEYAAALLKGDSLEADKKEAIAKRMAELTGLSAEFILRSNLRVSGPAFNKEFLRDQARTVGRFDSRYKGIDRSQIGTHMENDPSLSAVMGAYTASLNAYVRGELGFKSDLPYEILTDRVHPWNFNAQNRFLNVSEQLRATMAQNTFLKVLFATGYYDLATPYFATDYTISHLGLDPSLRGNVTTTNYDAGHMMYVRDTARRKLKADIADFYKMTLATEKPAE